MAKKNLDLAPSRKEHNGFGQFVLGVCLVLFTIFCFAPVLLVFISAFTDEKWLTQHGYSFLPGLMMSEDKEYIMYYLKAWSINGMKAILKYGQKLGYSYIVTIGVTVVGTFLGLLVMSMYAYAISRKDFRLSKFFSIYLLIPMLFNGGQLSGYIIFTGSYGLKNNLLALILPLCVTTMNVIILRTYIANSIPNELMEAAKIDGAGEYRTFFQITLPLLKPSLAAVGFMMATGYWNDWQNALLYIDDNKLQPLQLLLINIQSSISVLLNNANVPQAARDAMGGSIPQQSSTMATVIVVIAPIMVIYPFFQKYFIKGLTVGSVKG